MKKVFRKIMAAVGLIVVFPIFASAATLQILGGELTGATGIDVRGSLYDVEFVDLTCAAAFTGCDSSTDFTFYNNVLARDAAVALLNEVFVGAFDIYPELTRGINNPNGGNIIIPYANGVYVDSSMISVYMTVNGDGTNRDWYYAGGGGEASYYDGLVLNNVDHSYTYSRWTPSTPVPEPSSLLMIIPGMIGLVYSRRKRALQ